MKRFRLIAAVFAGTLFYVIFSVVAGRDGIWARSQLNDQKRILSTHAAELEKINGELLIQKTALQNDDDVVRAYARKLGYVNDGEKLVKIIGLPLRTTRIYDAGTLVKHSEVKYIGENVCKMLGLVIFALVYAVLLLFDFSRGLISLPSKTRSAKLSESTVVYDMH